MRKYHLLLAEWRLAQHCTERRFYILASMWADKDANVAALFPLMNTDPAADATADDLDNFGELDEGASFSRVAASMGAR